MLNFDTKINLDEFYILIMPPGTIVPWGHIAFTVSVRTYVRTYVRMSEFG